MNPAARRTDALRERLLAAELALARRELAERSIEAIVARAGALIREVEATRTAFDALLAEVEPASPAEQARLVGAYLGRQPRDGHRPAPDLDALRRGAPGTIDLGALGEHAARRADELECRAEALLVVARLAIERSLVEETVAEILFLARAPGRWSRRTEAIALVKRLTRLGLARDEHATARDAMRRLSASTEHRWVQPAALSALFLLAPEEAHALARERLGSDAGGDDFIVRSRIVALSARLRGAGWEDLLPQAHRDPSNLVRLSATRVERSESELARIADEDPSHKVRALALIGLVRRARERAVPWLERALVRDPNGFVVCTAAEELTALARRSASSLPGAAGAALWAASHRMELSPAVRAACEDALLEVTVATPELRPITAELGHIARETRVGHSTRTSSERLVTLPDHQLGLILSVLARDDFGLSVDRTRRGLVVHRGERRRWSLWRVLFELTHPGPGKRQGFDHTLGSKPRGTLRAPPRGLAEVTATRVPGQRVLAAEAGGWGRHLPLVDDLLSLGVLRRSPVSISSSFGLTRISPPPSFTGRLRAWLSLTTRYSHFAEQRQRALASGDPLVQAAFARHIEESTGMSLEITPYAFDVSGARQTLRPPGALRASASTAPTGPASLALVAGMTPDGTDGPSAPLAALWDEFTAYVVSPGGNRLSHLAAFGAVLLGAMLARGVTIRHRVEAERRSIPLVVGGWGTRGKSGTERLKAALFHGLGYECLVKTTGCEAMFIHSIPGLPAEEVFIYRPYDKATVWEQREVLSLAHRLGVRVFLWECMALQPDLVNLLQAQWMHHDLSTITNAYPDHEDVQGPTGLDVAATIGEFVPAHGELFTSEDQMLPVIRERARALGSRAHVVSERDAELIADDLLARFSHSEHPRNVALVAALARHFGIPQAVAITEMADHLVPDLGVLKTYPTVPFKGRLLSFTNGMGANDRAGTLQNWQRSGFAELGGARQDGRWVVTVVNNRADRVARSEVFANLLVRDVTGHRHVLIGTNVEGLLGFLRDALEKYLREIAPCRDLPAGVTERGEIVRARVTAAFLRLGVDDTSAESLQTECEALGIPPISPALAERLLSPRAPGESPESLERELRRPGTIPEVDDARLPFVTEMVLRRRIVRAVLAEVDRSLGTEPARVDAVFGAAYRALFFATLVPVRDAAASGDAILDVVATSIPPGARATIMGLQNIKGTGLDFVYRWVSIDVVCRAVEGLDSPDPSARRDALTRLLLHEDYGIVDATFALAAVDRAGAADNSDLPYDAVRTRLEGVVRDRESRTAARRAASFSERLRGRARSTLDSFDSIRRRRQANRVLSDLVHGVISHRTAAIRMRAITRRASGPTKRES